MDVFDSKTARFWLILIVIAFIFIMFVTIAHEFFGVSIPLVDQFFEMLKITGGAQTTRNVMADHVMPRVNFTPTIGMPPVPPAPSAPVTHVATQE